MADFLKGKVLIASPSLRDPNFQRTVILLCDHHREGALGLVYNRPSPLTLAEAMPVQAEAALSGQRLYLGGPVEPGSLFVVHRVPELGGTPLGQGIFWGADEGLLAALTAEGQLEESFRLFAGYAGWGEGQLEFELSQGAWIAAPLQPHWVFDLEGVEAWRKALQSLGGQYAILAEAPVDPELN